MATMCNSCFSLSESSKKNLLIWNYTCSNDLLVCTFKTWKSNLVRTTRFWNNLYQLRSKPKKNESQIIIKKKQQIMNERQSSWILQILISVCSGSKYGRRGPFLSFYCLKLAKYFPLIENTTPNYLLDSTDNDLINIIYICLTNQQRVRKQCCTIDVGIKITMVI